MNFRKTSARRRHTAPRGYAVMPSAVSTRALALAVANRRALYASAARADRAQAELAHLRHTAGVNTRTTTPTHAPAPAGYTLVPAAAFLGAVTYTSETHTADALNDLVTEADHTTENATHDALITTDHFGERDIEAPDTTAPAGYDVMPLTAAPEALTVGDNCASDLSFGIDMGAEADHGVDSGI